MKGEVSMYVLAEAVNPLDIRERQYSYGQVVMFSHMNSCIAVLGKITYKGSDQVIGVHLALRDAQDTPIALGDVPQIRRVLDTYGYCRGSGRIIGQIAIWRENFPHVWSALLHDLDGAELEPCGNGYYGGRLDRFGKAERTDRRDGKL
jgi:hypothetical protein